VEAGISRQQAWELLKQYNKDPFHIQHALTVEGVMKWFAKDQGFVSDEEFWSVAGLLHDIDFEQFPDQHCVKAPELLRTGGVSEELIHAVCSHGYGLTVSDVKPEHIMEKILFASDELTGLIWAAAIIRPSKSVMDMEVKSVKKKYKTPAFAAGCSRKVIEDGAALLGWELDFLIEKTILAMRSCEAEVNAAVAAFKNA
jgi:predicted hydrolase (HD superfamily)